MTDNSCVIQSATSGLKPIMIRRRTDMYFIVLVPLHFLLWLGIAIYDIPMETWHENNCRKKLTMKVDNNDPCLDLILLRSLANITIYTIVSVLIMIVFLFVTTILKARWIVFAAISLIVITIISFIMLITWEFILLYFDSLKTHSLKLFLVVALIMTLLYLIYQVTIFVCTSETNINFTAELISKSCPSILQSFLAILIILGIAFLSIIVLMITINTFLYKMFDYYYSSLYLVNYLDMLRLPIFFIGGIHISNFIWNFGFTVMSDYFAHFYARSDSEKLTSAYISKSISRVARYHLGTVSFLSMPILPSICALAMAFKNNRQYSTKSFYWSISFFSKLCLIIDITDYALVQTSINGYKALKSISEMFELHQRSSLLFLTLNAISTKIIEIGIVFATIVGMIIRLWCLPMYQDIPFSRIPPLSKQYTDDMMAIYQIFIAAIYISFIYKSVTRSAMCTFSIYQMNCIRMSETIDDRIVIAEQSM